MRSGEEIANSKSFFKILGKKISKYQNLNFFSKYSNKFALEHAFKGLHITWPGVNLEQQVQKFPKSGIFKYSKKFQKIIQVSRPRLDFWTVIQRATVQLCNFDL
jgi:hypothetical protein